MPARIASGRFGQALMSRARSGSIGAFSVSTAPDSAPPWFALDAKPLLSKCFVESARGFDSPRLHCSSLTQPVADCCKAPHTAGFRASRAIPHRIDLRIGFPIHEVYKRIPSLYAFSDVLIASGKGNCDDQAWAFGGVGEETHRASSSDKTLQALSPAGCRGSALGGNHPSRGAGLRDHLSARHPLVHPLHLSRRGVPW